MPRIGKNKEEESKNKVSEIQEMKDRLKQENDNLKKIKHQLKENQEKQKVEKDVRMIQKCLYYALLLYYSTFRIATLLYFPTDFIFYRLANKLLKQGGEQKLYWTFKDSCIEVYRMSSTKLLSRLV